jgi:serine/threonine-protein kinase
MSAVWAARHELLGRELALKFAGGQGRSEPDLRAMFMREAQIVGKLRHPNIVDIADAGEVGPGQGLYLAMELLEGESLATRIALRPLSPADALAVAAAVCRGLAAAHRAGVVHRDLKPENIFLARGAAGGVVPKLLDFGVSSARHVSSLDPGHLFATPAYMSPEQALGESGCEPRTDVWALGVVLYEMLTGRHPFTASSYAALLPRIIEAPYAALPEDLPAEVRSVVAGCLAKDRADRYGDADALLTALERARLALPAPDSGATPSGLFVEAGAEPPPARGSVAPAASPRAPRRGLALAILAVPVTIGIVALAGTGRLATPAAAPPPPPTVVAPASAPALPPASAVPAAAVSALPPPSASAAPARAPAPRPAPGRGRPVTRIDSAGF